MVHDAEEARAAGAEGGWPAVWPLLLFALSAAIVLILYRSCLGGEFLSDDYGYIVTNPYTAELSRENVLAIVHPAGQAKFYTANYAPVHLLLTGLEQQIFADDVVGYHLVNLLIHAANAVLLVALLVASGLPRTGALLGGLLFVVHPANVEAVAWISQLKTNGSLALSLAALLALRRHPALGTLLFALALLTKAAAASALPVAAAFVWAWRGTPGGSPARWAWVGAWAVILGLFAIPQFDAFAHIGGVDVPAYDDRLVQLRTIAAVGMRYLVMAATSYGVSAFQEPPLARSWLDPWWLAALPAGALLGGRAIVSLRRRSEEGAYWVFAAASFGIISQLFPFLHPVADRYLYFLLPGLIGGVLFVGMELQSRLAFRSFGRAAALAALALAALFAVRTAERAPLWRHETRLLVDAAAHYPEGGTAAFLRARSAAQVGDVDAAVAELRSATERGIDSFTHILGDPGLAPIAGAPAFQQLVRDVAGRWIERAGVRGYSTQAELRMLGLAHFVREEYAEAELAFEGALRAGGPLETTVRTELEAVRVKRGGGHGDRVQKP